MNPSRQSLSLWIMISMHITMDKMVHQPGLRFKAMGAMKTIMVMEGLRRNHVELGSKKMGKFNACLFFSYQIKSVHCCGSSDPYMSYLTSNSYDFCTSLRVLQAISKRWSCILPLACDGCKTRVGCNRTTSWVPKADISFQRRETMVSIRLSSYKEGRRKHYF